MVEAFHQVPTNGPIILLIDTRILLIIRVS